MAIQLNGKQEVRSVLRSFHVGTDLGQQVDHTAIVVVEQAIEFAGERDRATYEPICRRRLTVRLARRLSLLTGYGEVVEGVKELMESPELAKSNGVTLSYDATGAGSMAADWFRTVKLPGHVYPVVFTAGDVPHYKEGRYLVPKNALMVGMMRAFEVDGLRVAADVDGWGDLEAELLSIRRLPGGRYNAGTGARWVSEGEHDDMAMALALALHGCREQVLPERGDRVRRRVG